MLEEFIELKKDIESLTEKENIISFLLYGSMLTDRNNANDLDGVIIVKKVDGSLKSLFKLLENKYKKLDFNIYSEEEVLNNLSYYTREFKLEYLSKALCLYGKNILEDKSLEVSSFSYKQSILIRSIEHLQLVRQKYFLSSVSDDIKLAYFNKYLIRICKNILLFKGLYSYINVNNLSEREIIIKISEIKHFNIFNSLENIKSPEDYILLFNILSKILIKLKSEL